MFKNFRLMALKVNPESFASSYADEVTKTPEEWQDTVQGSDHQVFGLFENEDLIGITACFTWREDPAGETALLAMSFVKPEFRDRGLSRLLYEGRLDWIRSRKQFKRVVVSHRLSNDISRRANQRHGFVFTGRIPRKWPDGSREDEAFYEMRLK